MKNKIKDYFLFTLLIFINALYYQIALRPFKIVAGGSSGLSIIVEDIFRISPSRFVFIFCMIIIIFSFVFLGFKRSVSALYVSFLFPFFLKILENVPTFIDLGVDDVLIVSFIVGLLSGFVVGGTKLLGFGLGGVSQIGDIIEEKLHISSSTAQSVLNILIVLVGIRFGIMNLIYALIIIFVGKNINDRITQGISKNKMLLIITDEDEKVMKYLKKENVGATVLNAIGGYSNKKDELILTAVSTRRYIDIRDEVKKIDDNVFIVVLDSYSVKGGVI